LDTVFVATLLVPQPELLLLLLPVNCRQTCNLSALGRSQRSYAQHLVKLIFDVLLFFVIAGSHKGAAQQQ
jgi:hypothetical protein